jgi:hypothetical protein
MGLFFDREETLKGYYEMMWQILNKYGIPEAFYGDNRTIFEFRRLSEKNQTIDPRRAHQLQTHVHAARDRAHHHLRLPGQGKDRTALGDPSVEADIGTSLKGCLYRRANGSASFFQIR